MAARPHAAQLVLQYPRANRASTFPVLADEFARRSDEDLASAVCHVVKPGDSHGGQHDPLAVFDVALVPVGVTLAGNAL